MSLNWFTPALARHLVGELNVPSTTEVELNLQSSCPCATPTTALLVYYSVSTERLTLRCPECNYVAATMQLAAQPVTDAALLPTVDVDG